MWAMSYSFRKRKAIEFSTEKSKDKHTAIHHTELGHSETIQEAEVEGKLVDDEEEEDEPGEVGIAGLGVGRHWGRRRRDKMIARGAAVNSMLEGYYPIVRRAVATALVGRLTVVSLLVVYAWRRYNGRA